MSTNLHAVIMAGGSGTRFWPESRKNKPKQLLSIVDHRTMIRATVERILPLVPFERILVVTAASHAEKIIEQIPELSDSQVVVEPLGRNTGPCIALAAYKLFQMDPGAVMVVLPADHVIGREDIFLSYLSRVYDLAARENHLVTFGIKPTRPETGYGYIKMGEFFHDVEGIDAYYVEQFVEKPDASTARDYLIQGSYLWNSGMFVWNVSTIIHAFEKYLPMISRRMEKISSALNTSEEPQALASIYRDMEDISIDTGIMERADKVLVIPLDVDWNDVGSWASLQDVWEKDPNGNAFRGKVVSVGSHDCVISSPKKIVALVGVENLILVDTEDAILLCRKDKAQDVKKLQTVMNQIGYEELL